MIRLGRWQVSIEGLLALGLLVALSLGGIRLTAYRMGRDDGRLAQLEANAHKASKAGIVSRRAVDSVTRRMTTQVASVERRGARLDTILDSADVVIADTAARVTDLRAALISVTDEARVYRDSTRVLLASVTALVSAHETERAASDSLVAAQRAVIRALGRRECRILGVRCPTRKSVFIAGVITTIGVIAVVK